MSTPSRSPGPLPDRPADGPPEDTSLAARQKSLGAQLLYGSIVVATSGDADGAGPVRVASALQQRFGATVSAVQVLDTARLPLPTPLPFAFTLARELIGEAPYAEDALARQAQFAEWLGTPNEWPVHVGLGVPSQEIIRYAQQRGAALVVLGLRRHGIVDRVLRDETTLQVAQHANRAVLGVAPTLRGLPRRAIVGVDFGPASVRAARAALDLLAPTENPADPADLRLVHVDRNPGDEAREATAGGAVVQRLGVAAAFEQLVAELSAPAGVRVECVARRGEPATELVAYADEVGADVIAIGSLRHERIERWILGSVTTELIRDGRCSVLVIPP